MTADPVPWLAEYADAENQSWPATAGGVDIGGCVAAASRLDVPPPEQAASNMSEEASNSAFNVVSCKSSLRGSYGAATRGWRCERGACWRSRNPHASLENPVSNCLSTHEPAPRLGATCFVEARLSLCLRGDSGIRSEYWIAASYACLLLETAAARGSAVELAPLRMSFLRALRSVH